MNEVPPWQKHSFSGMPSPVEKSKHAQLRIEVVAAVLKEIAAEEWGWSSFASLLTVEAESYFSYWQKHTLPYIEAPLYLNDIEEDSFGSDCFSKASQELLLDMRWGQALLPKPLPLGSQEAWQKLLPTLQLLQFRIDSCSHFWARKGSASTGSFFSLHRSEGRDQLIYTLYK